MFRVGMSDETLPQRGFSHLVEHLALQGFDDPALQWNGFVDVNRTVFHATGPQDRVEAFLVEVAGRLDNLPFDRLATERSVMAAESRRRGANGPFGELMSRRWGARGFGTCGWWELGLPSAVADTVEEWRRTYFTRGNAIVWLTSPPSQALSLDLADGPRRPVVATAPVLDGRAWFRHGAPGISLLARAPRTSGGSLAAQSLLEALQRTLRDEGLSYATTSAWQRLTAQDAALFATCDASPQRDTQVANRLLEVLDEVTQNYNQQRLDEVRERRRLAVEDTDAEVRSWLDAMAFDLLVGRERTTIAESRAEEASCSPAEVKAALDMIRRDALVMVPWDAAVSRSDTPRYPDPKRAAVPGTSRPYAILYQRSEGAHRLQVGDVGVSIQAAEHSSTVLYSDVAAMMRWADGTRYLIDRSGSGVAVEPRRFVDGEGAVAIVDAHVPPELAVDVGPRHRNPPTKGGSERQLAAFRVARGVITGALLLLGVISLTTLPHALGIVLLVSVVAVMPIWAIWATPAPRSYVWDMGGNRSKIPEHLDRGVGLVPGGLLLGWVADRRHFADRWAQQFTADLAAFDAREITGPELYRRMGAALTDDMIDAECNEFFTDYLGQGKRGYDLDLRQVAGRGRSFFEIPDTWASQTTALGVIDRGYEVWAKRGRHRTLRHLRRTLHLGVNRTWTGGQANERALRLLQWSRHQRWT